MNYQNKLDRYEILGKLGEGRYGVVYKARNKITNKFYAFKKIRADSKEEGIPSNAIREISLLKELKHTNIVKIQDVIYINKDPTIVIDYVDQDLRHFLKMRQGKQLNSHDVKCLMYQLLKGVECCHSSKIVHRDLKPQNLLLSNEGILKIADFGLARSVGIPAKNMTIEVVTLPYRAPDVLLGSETYSTCIDMWSIGCIFVEIANLQPLFTSTTKIDLLNNIFKITGTPSTTNWPELANLPGWKEWTFKDYYGIAMTYVCPSLDEEGLNLLEQLLKCNPAERISAKKALEHPYFNDVPLPLKQLCSS
jgi:serine/threonine protein kinase